jgi:hypothetical protein
MGVSVGVNIFESEFSDEDITASGILEIKNKFWR